MTRRTYSPLVIDHFERPRGVGAHAPGPDVIVGEAGRLDQGAVFHLSARIAGVRLAEVRFRAYGCPHCLAAASWLTQRLDQATLEDVQRFRWREAAQVLDIPAEKAGRLLVLEDAVAALAAHWAQRTRKL